MLTTPCRTYCEQLVKSLLFQWGPISEDAPWVCSLTPCGIQAPQFRVEEVVHPCMRSSRTNLHPQHILAAPMSQRSKTDIVCCVQWDKRIFRKISTSLNDICRISIIRLLVCTAPSGLFLLFTHNLKSTRVASQDCPLPWIYSSVHMPCSFLWN